MKKNTLYIGLAVLAGLLIGYLIFGSRSESDTTKVHDQQIATSQMWTCSMHPQIMQPEPGDCPICGMDLIPAASGDNGLAMNEIKMTKNAMALANVQTTVVGVNMSEGESITSLSGKIKRNEEATAIQASYFDGRIERLNVNFEGQLVRKGHLLATIYAPSLVAAQQELITAASLKEKQPSLYQAVRKKLKIWKLSDAQINAIETSGKVQENFPIYAAVSGTVSEKMASEGDYVKQGQPLVKVSDLNSVWAEFDAYEHQISEFKTGQKIKVTTNAYPNKTFKATVSFVDPVLNDRTRTVTVRAHLDNTDGIFKPGMFVTGSVEHHYNNSEAQINIPASAVMWTGERSLVYKKTDPDRPVFQIQEVTLGRRIGDTFNLVSGLKNGDEIVTNGTFTVDAAAQLQGKKSMMGLGDEREPVVAMDMNLPESLQKELTEALSTYMQLKDAFVSSNSSEVSVFAKAMEQKLQTMTNANLGKMANTHVTKGIEMLKAIGTDDKLENQRAHFVILNENLIPMAMHLKNLDKTLFIQKCPMANNNKGAVWISKEKEIKNPYYGEDMLNCGSVIDSLP